MFKRHRGGFRRIKKTPADFDPLHLDLTQQQKNTPKKTLTAPPVLGFSTRERDGDERGPPPRRNYHGEREEDGDGGRRRRGVISGKRRYGVDITGVFAEGKPGGFVPAAPSQAYQCLLQKLLRSGRFSSGESAAWQTPRSKQDNR
ncbi:hypothetical protein EYF80_042455 [Liparis tanakae]|uniref:Uncharacterized protein n=1 Tax=Liparis tanakae TaxID=230148 RepID=A0A4Z2G1B2_9TELE|nr:hypothetical protein EYF80_042455 [Liparis tanakae]